MADPALERLVVETGSLVDYPALPDLSVAVGRRIRQGPAPSRWTLEPLRLRIRALRPVLQPAWQPVAVALVVLIALLSGTLALSPTARRAVADWLGLRGVRIQFTPAPSASPLPLGTGLNLGEKLTLAEAQARVPYRIVIPHLPELGPPDAVYLRSGNFDRQVTLLWHARPGLPKARETGEGLLLTQFRATIEADFIKKITSQASTLEPVTVDGGDGFWIAGPPHELLFVDAEGNPLPDTLRLAGNVLLWERGDLTVRIEGELTKAQALRIASSVS